MKPIGNAWTLAVVSTDGQEETLATQQALLEAFAADHGWNVTRRFEEISSGKAGVRKAFLDMMAALRAEPPATRPATVILKRQDRVGRGRILDTQIALAELRELGVKMYTVLEGEIANETWMDDVINTLRAGVAQHENAVRSDKLRAGHARRRAEGKRWAAPYGTQLTPEKTLVAIEPHASLVRTAFELRATGAGYERIARAIAPGAPPQPKKDGTSRTMGWHRTFIAWMLKHDAYRGLVVPEDLWDAVQLVRNTDFKQVGARRWPWPLKGVRCLCGACLTGVATMDKCSKCRAGKTKHQHSRIRYYRCNNPIAHAGRGARRSWRADLLEGQFVDLLRRLESQPEMIEGYRRDVRAIDTTAMQLQLRAIERDLAKLEARSTTAWDMQADGVIDKSELAERLASLRVERTGREAEIADLRRAIVVATAEATIEKNGMRLLSNAAENWTSSAEEAQRDIARLVGRAVGGLFAVPEHGLLSGVEMHYLGVVFPVKSFENMRQINTLRDVEMTQRKEDNSITKKFIQSISE